MRHATMGRTEMLGSLGPPVMKGGNDEIQLIFHLRFAGNGVHPDAGMSHASTDQQHPSTRRSILIRSGQPSN